MILTLLDLAVATVVVTTRGVYNTVKYGYNWYYSIEEEPEPTPKDLREKMLQLEEKIDEMMKQNTNKIS